MKPPFSLTFNLQYIIFLYFYLYIFQKEQNLTRSSSLEIKNPFSLLRWLAFVQLLSWVLCFICSKEGYCYDKKRKLFQLIFFCKGRFRSRTIEFKFRPVAVTSQAPIFHSKPIKFQMENRSFW